MIRTLMKQHLKSTLMVAVLAAVYLLYTGAVRDETAQAQATLNQVTVHALQQVVYEGGLAQFSIRRVGGTVSSQTVYVKTWETEHDDPVHGNLTEQVHAVTFPRLSRDVTLSVAAYNDERSSREGDLSAEVQASPDNEYDVGSPSLAAIDVLSYYEDTTSPVVNIESVLPLITEGSGNDVQFRIRRTRDTSQDTTVLLRVEDPGDRLRGNHWDPPPELPTQLVVLAGQTSATLTIPLPDDHRDAATFSEKVTAVLLPSHDYLLHPSSGALTPEDVPVADEVYVRDDDDAQELELNFGKDGTNDADASEGDTLKFIVKRRSTDTGNPARFTVRVETDRSGPDMALDDWTEDTDADILYRDYSYELTGTDTQVEQELPVTANGEAEDDWTYTARILSLQDHQRNDLDSAVEALYWTVKTGFRETEIEASDSGASTGTVTLSTTATTVQEGDQVVYTLTRMAGKRGEEITVQVRTWEPNRADPGNNPSQEFHTVVIPPWEATAMLTVHAYVDTDAEPGADRLRARITSVTGGDYERETGDFIAVEINDPPSTSAAVTIAVDDNGIVEGTTATFTFTRTGGNTTQALPVDIRVDDLRGLLRGNHWEPAPDIPTEVVFAAGSTSETITITPPDDERDLPAANFSVTVLPGNGYHPGNTGLHTRATVTVADNDVPQELSFQWGWIDFGDSDWETGQSYLQCNGTCANGPAEGTWYYTDGRTFDFYNEVETYWPVHFQVSRRNQDKSRTAKFTVRVEHDRGWLSPRHSDWTLDPSTGKHYKDFPLTLATGQRSVVVRIEVLDNSQDIEWKFSAKILPMTDSATGADLDTGVEAQYWAVSGQRERDIQVSNAGVSLQINLLDPQPHPVPEGDQVQFPVQRIGGYALDPVTVQVRTWEPSRRLPAGDNPSEQVHTLTFPALTLSSEFIRSRDIDQTQTITVTTRPDTNYEVRDTIRAEVVSVSHEVKTSQSKLEHRALIRDDDRPAVTLTADTTSITEGETVTFTLARDNSTEAMTVGVSVEDPGGSLEGNYPSDAVSVPSSVAFAAGDAEMAVEITPPDDRRDKTDSVLTFMVQQEPHYEISGASSIDVTVVDNDTAPQVSISFSQEEVEEGQNLVLWITRTGQDTNPIEVPVTVGPVGDQRYIVFRLGPGITRYGLSYASVDDDYKGPDTHYEATLHPQDPEFWVAAGNTTINAVVLDNDLYTVGIERIRINWDEGGPLRFRVFHDGHTGEEVPVNLLIEEIGSAVDDDLLGERPARILRGSRTLTPVIYTEANDGSDGDAIFTVRLLPGDGYVIDPDHDIAAMIVKDLDPLPVLRFRNNRVDIPEAAGTGEVFVELESALPVPRRVSVGYEVVDSAAADDGEDFTAATGRLTFEPGETSKAIEVEILQDKLAEADEQFSVYLKEPIFSVMEDGQESLLAVAAIVDDEPTITMEAAQEAVTEGTDVVFNLTRTESTADELTVYMRVDKSSPFAGRTLETVVFQAGDSTSQLVVPTEDDDVRLGTYTVRAGMEYPPIIGKPHTYWREAPLSDIVTVRDNELESVRLLVEEGRVIEGDPVTFTLRRGNAETTPLEVSLQIEAPAGYTTGPIPSTVTFPANSNSVVTTIWTVDDSTVEENGELTVTILDGTGYRPTYPNTFTFSIFDDDGALPAVRVNGTTAWVDEGEDVVFAVIRSGSTTDPLDARLRLYRLRSRVTQAELDDPTLGVTTPVHLVPLDQEEITVTFPAGTNRITVTRSTTDDSFNYGNSSYHAFVLADADDDYTAFYEHTDQIWVQDDDRPVVTIGNASTTDYYGYPGEYYPGIDRKNDPIILSFNLTRTGDTSGMLPVAVWNQQTTRWPAPKQDETGLPSTAIDKSIKPGEATSTVTQTGFQNVNALGRSRTMFLAEPHNCPDDPEECGYGPQYTLGSVQDATVQVRSNLMGVRIQANQSSVTEGAAATFTLHRHGGKPDAMTRPLTVRVGVTQEGDYINGTTPQTVTFLANQATTALTVSTDDDDLDESNGAVTATILIPTSLTNDEHAYESGIYFGTPWDIHLATTVVNDNNEALPEISVSDHEVDEDEGTVTFTVSLATANNDNDVTFDWTTQDGAAVAGSDYQAASGSETISARDTSIELTVSITNDTLPEPDETFDVVLSNLSYAQAGDTTGTITILDNELDFGVTINHAPSGVEEGGEIPIVIRRFAATVPSGTEEPDDLCFRDGGQPVMCFTPIAAALGKSVLTLNVRVTQTGDFISHTLPATANFEPGDRFAFVWITSDDDSLVEANGALTVTILNGQGYTPVFTGAVSTETVDIYDNDLTFSVADATATEAAGATVDFTVSLNATAPEQVSVVASTVDGEATSHGNVTPTDLGQDFEAKTETITFAQGEQSKTFSVAIMDDTIQEKSETFTVELSGQPEHATLADAVATGTVLDDEQPMVASVSRSYAVVNEDHAGPVQFMVELTHADTTASERNPAVAWEITAGTATEGEDYLAADGKVFFPVGGTTGFIQVDLVDDNLLEATLETFSVDLLIQGSRLVEISGTDNSFEASIRDNETFSAKITADAEFVVEGNDATFTVTLTGGVTAQDVQVTFETGGTAEPGDDYNTPIGAITFPQGDRTGSSGTLTIPAGQSQGTISFPVIRDETEDPDETIEVQIFTVSSASRTAAVAAGDEMASATILDQDAVTVSLQGSPSVTEGTAATFTLVLSNATDEAVSAEWSATGVTATAGDDFTGTSGTISIPAQSTTATLTIPTVQDTVAEGDETFTVTLVGATKGTDTPPEMVPLGVTEQTGTILDDDTPPDSLSVTADPDRVAEDAGATDLTVTVTLGGTTQFAVDTPVTVEFINRPNNPNNATLGEDYTATSVTATIPAGQSSVTETVTITPVDDNFSENTEIARLTANSAAMDASDAFNVRIEDNDVEPLQVTLTVSPDELDESANVVALQVTASLVGPSLRGVDTVVTMSSTDGTATVGQDYEALSTTLTIPAGEESASTTLNLTVLEDNVDEDDETFQVTGTVPGTITVTPDDITILDDDNAPTSISLSADSIPVNEDGGAVTIPVRATLLGGGTRGEDTVVTLRTVDLTATETDDYTASFSNSTLTIPAGQYSATEDLTITPVDDTFYEGNESIAVRGENTSPGLPVSGVRINILDDDPAPATIQLAIEPPTLSESFGSGFVTITATLQGDSTLPTDTRIPTRMASSDPESDATGTEWGSPLIIDAGMSEGTARFLLGYLNDRIDKPDQTLEITGRTNNPDLTVLPAQIVVQDDDTSGVTVTPTSLTIGEGLSRRYAVYLDSEPAESVTINIDVPAGAAFTVSPGSLTFTDRNWHYSQRVRVRTALDLDGDDEPAAAITHTADSDDTLYRGITVASVDVTVTDRSSATVTVDPTSLSLDEGGTSGSYTVTLDIEPTADVTVTIGGHTGTDLNLDKTTLTFTTINWGTSQTVTVTAGQDDDAVQDSVTLTHTVTGGGYDGATAADVAVTVTDDDTVGVNISESSLGLDEGDEGTYTVVLDTQPAGDVTVTVAGHAGTDISVDVTELTFTTTNWDTTQTVTVTAEQDGDSANEAQVTLTHTVASTDDSTYNGLAADSVSVDVTDDDTDGITVSPTELTVTEGLTAEYTVVLDTIPPGEVTVTINDPTDNTDVTADPSSLTFTTTNWNIAQTVTVSAVQDNDADDETATITHRVTGYGSVTAADVEVTLEDDAPESFTISFEQASYTVAESDDPNTADTAENEVTIKVQLSKDPERTVTVPLTHQGQDGAGSGDYSGVPVSVTFNSGETEEEITLTAAHDTDDDDGESVLLGFDTLPDGVTVGDNATTTVSITDDDDPSVTVSFGAATYTVAESDDPNTTGTAENKVTVRVLLSVDPERTVTIPLTHQGQDGAGSGDYSGVPASVTFNSGDTEREITLTATHDTVDDDGEKVKIGFGPTLPNGVSAGTPNETVVSIQDDDHPELKLIFAESSYTVAEGSSETITIQLSAAPEREVQIGVTTTPQGDTSAADYSGPPTTVTIGAQATTGTLTFTATDDTVDDDGESVRLGFSATLPDRITPDATIHEGQTAPRNVTTVNITDNDDPSVTVRFEQESYTAAEGATATVKLLLSAAPEREVQITLLKANQGGATTSDYSGVPSTVTFSSTDTEKTFTFSATADDVDDDGESVKLTISSSLPDGVSRGTPNEATVNITDDDVPSVTVSFEQGSYTVAEGNSVTVKLKLSADPERTVTISITKDNQDGATDSDYSGVPTSVTFNSGDTEKEFSFTATDDTVDDDGESVKLGFGSTLPDGVSEGTTDETVVSITDDDVPSVTVTFEQATYTVAEGNSVTVKVRLSADPERAVTIPITKDNQDGATAADYSGVPTSVTFNSGDTEQEITFTASQDTTDDDGESVKLGFGSTLPDGVSEGTTDETVVSITDDDVPAVTVSFEQGSYTVAEGSTVSVKVKLSADPERTVTIPLTKDNQDGASNADYSGVPTNVVFNSGDTEKFFNFTATQDTTDDDGESVKLGFGPSLPTGVTEGSTNETVVSITDDDVPSVTVSFEQGSYTVAEGGTVSVKVKLSADPERTVTIPLTKDNQDGATDSDYSGVPTNVVFNSGDTEKSFTFSATQDTVDDDGESVKLGFDTLPTGVTEGSTNETVVSITDDDVPSVTVSFEQGSYTVAEGNTTTITITLSADPERLVTIPLTHTPQDGATAQDYSGVPPTGIIFLTGETEKNFDLRATNDTLDDDGESVKLGFGSPLPTGISEGTHAETVVSITDDDHPQLKLIFAESSYTVTEGTSETITIELSAVPEREVQIGVTATPQGDTTAADYSGVPTTVTIGAQSTTGTLSITATDDTEDDDGETVRLGFSATLPAGITPDATIHEGQTASRNVTTVSITDDDVPSVTVSYEEGTYTVAEGNDVTVKVKLSADAERTVTIPITKDNQGGATDADYSGVPASVVFNSGDTEKEFTFTATQDTTDDDGESVKLGFGSTLPTGVSEGTLNETTVNITDDDVPSVTVRFEQSTYTVAEGNDVTVKVLLSAAPEREAEITLLKANQDGATASDYSGVPATVTFSSTDTEKEFTFSATADDVDDDGESVKLTISGTLPAGVSRGTPNETVVSITDDDVPSVTVSYEEGTYTVAEGNDVTVKVKLSADAERTVTIPITKDNQGGATDADYSGVPASVVFNSGDTEKEFTFTATQDTVDDDGESVKLGFGSTLPTGVSEGTLNETTVNITDDDTPESITVSFGAGTYSALEGGSTQISVTLSDDPERTVEIPLGRNNLDGASDSDYSGVPASLTFNSGDTEREFTFTAQTDLLEDPGEKVKLTFGTLPQGVTLGTTSETTVSILEVSPQSSLSLSFGAPDYTVAEGNSVTITVNLNQAPGSEVQIPITTDHQGGATASDYSGVPASITFGATDTSKEITFTATQDTVDDDGESVKLGFGATLPAGVSEGTTDETVVSITDDDVPSVTVSYEEGTYTVAEGNDVTVKVKLSADAERTVTIPITKDNQGGATDADYSGVPASVVFNSGDTEKEFTFTATQDTTDDDGESVKLGFGSTLPTGVSEGTLNETTVNITDDDVPSVTVRFEQSTYTVAEGNDVTVKVKLSADAERTVTIPITKDNQGGATDADYSGVPASVVFNSGDTEKEFTFTATQDTTDDDGESVKLGFGSTLPTGVSEGTLNETTVNITDDDVPSVTVRFEQSTYTVAEGNDVTVKVLLSAAPEREAEITLLKANQDGATASDYSGVPATVTFSSTDTEKEFTFSATADDVDDDGESVKLTISGTLPAGVSRGTPNETVVSITDDDVPSVTVSYEEGTYTVAEGNDVTVKVKLSADAERTVTIPITKDNQGGATDADYSGVPASVVFNSGDTEKEFTFTATQDTTDDDGESVKLGFGSTLPTGVSEGTLNETTVNITDDDTTVQPQVSLQVSFEALSYTVPEGRTTNIIVQLSQDPERTVTIPITTTPGAGLTSDDYSGVPQEVTFNSGDTTASFIFTAVQDTVDEDQEELTLGFGTLPDQVTSESPIQSKVTIIDSVHVSFGASRYEAYEGGAGAIVTVELDGPSPGAVVHITADGMNGATSDDWTGVPTSLIFDAGDTQKTFTVIAYDDTIEDDGESVELGFGPLPAGMALGTPSTATVELMNMENNPVLLKCPSDSGQRFVLNQQGEITQIGDSQFWRVQLDPHRTYIIELLGNVHSVDVMGEDSSSENLTLDNPLLMGIWNDDRTQMLQRNPRGNRLDIVPGNTPSGWHQLEIKGNGGNGTYRIKVRVNNVCIMNDGQAMYTWFGGPDGYVFDTSANTSTDRSIQPYHESTWGFLGDNWEWYWHDMPDEDWFRVDSLISGQTYDIRLEADVDYPTRHQATDLKIVGIYDQDGDLVTGTEGEESGAEVSKTFQPGANGTYYIAVGSGTGDRTGLYNITIKEADT